MLRLLFRRHLMQSTVRNFTNQPPRFKKKPGLFAYSLLILPASCFALGWWQVGRRQWKLDLLARLKENLKKDPIPLPFDASTSADLPEYTPVSVRGQFDHSREVLIGPRHLIEDLIPAALFHSENKVLMSCPDSFQSTQGERRSHGPVTSPVGYYIVTPFKLADRPGQSILVNRGWVHSDMRDPATREDGQIKGTVEISGYVRYQEPAVRFGSFPIVWECVNKTTQHPHLQYYSRQVNEMAQQLDTLPLFVDATFASSVVGGPIGGQTRINLRNEHASYILTWFTLSIVGSVLWIAHFVM